MLKNFEKEYGHMRCTFMKLFIVFLMCSLGFIGGIMMKKTAILPIEIGVTTYEEIMTLDPNAKAIMTSYGYTTFHKLPNGKSIAIKFVHENNNFIAESYEIITQ